jgi:hypothetical protein
MTFLYSNELVTYVSTAAERIAASTRLESVALPAAPQFANPVFNKPS